MPERRARRAGAGTPPKSQASSCLGETQKPLAAQRHPPARNLAPGRRAGRQLHSGRRAADTSPEWLLEDWRPCLPSRSLLEVAGGWEPTGGRTRDPERGPLVRPPLGIGLTALYKKLIDLFGLRNSLKSGRPHTGYKHRRRARRPLPQGQRRSPRPGQQCKQAFPRMAGRCPPMCISMPRHRHRAVPMLVPLLANARPNARWRNTQYSQYP